MGWWRSGDNNDVIGDGPADTLAETLDGIARDRTERGQAKPTLQEFIDAVTAALRGQAGEGIAEDQGVTGQLVPESRNVHGQADRADETLLPPLRDAFDAIRAEYRESELNREPRPSEILESLAFVLRPSLDRYIADAEDIHLVTIVLT
jgi:hypothetical protein